MKSKTFLVLLAALLFTLTALSVPVTSGAQIVLTPTPSSYNTLLDGEIRGIDAATIQAYRNGQGMSLALPAELNGYPGPRHVLDLADALALTADQRLQVQKLFDTMKPEAIDLGNRILKGEAALEQSFRDQSTDDKTLETRLTELGSLQAKLRFVHLRTHLATIKILNAEQVMQYNMLRGYGGAGEHQQHQMNPTSTP